ncbi:uncharacterized protein LOC127786097 isoform X2 [Oryza glaberrima]|uniref:uncharacterized protein LOC127786097 isoform X2 n=1 Tax=Oryza glaberrima TaxID=4538 RepID=UPI00224C5DC1|nr:uncharacterized protein LOC127786097 isoform X2 [Oryza glaberrima]XP_052169386.1 uncharacterized protein LOC127786097 isoform X2 [Oryza glaberrima]
MSTSSGPSTHIAQHKRKEPLQDFATPDHFPVAFHLPSRRSVRRCMRTQPTDGVTTNEVNMRIDEPFSCDASSLGSSHVPSGRFTRHRRLLEFPHPDPMTATQSRRKRKIAMLAKLQKAHSTNQEIHRNVRPRIGPSDSCAPVFPSMCDHPNMQPIALADGASSSNPSAIPPPCSNHHHYMQIIT